MTLFLDSAVKISLLVGAALAAMPLLRQRSAALRHWILAGALLSAAAMPALVLVAPSWRVPLGAAPAALAPTVEVRDGFRYIVVAHPSGSTREAPQAPASIDERQPLRAGVVSAAGALWIAGALVASAVLLVGFARLRRLARRAVPLADDRWAVRAEAIARRRGVVRGVRLLTSDHPTLLVTWGIRRPTILLPSAARGWSDQRVDIVLQHELAHIERGDWFTQIAAEIVRCANWFNPIVWLACRELRRESERACDDAVLNGGIAPADYASHLVDLARALSAHRRPYVPAPAMARSSGLEGRIAAMLNARLNRRPVTRPAQIAAITVLLVAAVSVAGLRAQRFSTLSGTVVDQTNAVLPNVAVNVTNAAAQTRHEVRTDRTGHFELPGLVDGDYQLAIDEPGFGPLREAITISGRNIVRAIQLLVGDLHETLTITAGAAPSASTPSVRQAARDYAEARSRKIAERCGGAGAGPVDENIGGNVLAPMKIGDVKPRYPDGHAPGVVTLEALIGPDGTIRDVRLVSGDPDLGMAAADAIRRWEFSPTYLNCTPVEVRMGVTANFVAK